MKQITTILAVLVSFTMSAQLSSVTENSKTGQRLTVSDINNHGDIGSNAVDLSYSNSVSTTKGATGNASTAMGYGTIASGLYSTAMGYATTASNRAGTAMGDRTTASAWYSTAMGTETTASGANSTAMGSSTTASGDASTAMGYGTTASGANSTAMGWGTTASDFASLSIGTYNLVNSVVTTGGEANNFDTDNAAFVIGNGYYDYNSGPVNSDAFVVYYNGNATLSGDLTINSDERLKDNIQPLGSTLNKLHQIEGKTYSFKKDEEHTPKIGVLAQEVQAVFPELVTEGADGILSVNYQGLVPVLINAINEQDAKIAALEAQNEQLAIASQKIAALEEMVRFLTVQQSQTTSSVAAN
jgi:hypothetical protein